VSRTDRERWVFTVELAAGIRHGGRFVARILKHLLRAWGVRCVALDESTEVKRLRQMVEGLSDRVVAQAELLARRAEWTATGSPTLAYVASGDDEATRRRNRTPCNRTC
jgi:hypothetical protein